MLEDGGNVARLVFVDRIISIRPIYMSDTGSPDFYRSRAAEMRAKAQAATTPTLVTSYRKLAENWERLADKAQQLPPRSRAHPEI